MKLSALVIGLALLASALPSYAGGIVMMGGGVPVSGPSYLLSENFTTGSAPSGWTAASSYILYNYATSPAPLEGDYSFCLNTVGTGSLYVASASFSTASGDVYIAYRYTQSTAANGDNSYVYVRDASNNNLCAIQHGIDDQLDGLNTGGTQVSNFITVTRDTAIYVKVHYVKGTGTNATVTYYTSTDGSTWTTEGTSSNGTSTADAANLQFTSSSASNNQLIFDQIRVSNSDINY